MISKIKPYFKKLCLTVSAVGLLAHGSVALSETAQERAMLNSTRIATMLDGVVLDKLHTIIENLESGKLARVAPEYPIWIMETIDNTILYYQGQPGFRGKNASQLVDDAGLRFGVKAINAANQSRSIWMELKLGERKYKAYCRSQIPIVVCTLMT